MNAAVAERYGPADVIEVREVEAPFPGRGQVRVRVRAASLNPLDVMLRSGSLRLVLPLRFPAVLGFDLAGEIEALGPDAAGFQIGDRVYGRIDRATGGTHAELSVVAAKVLDRVPVRLDLQQAAALPLTGMSALQALRDIAHLGEGQTLLVIGGAGGVGTAAVQIGRALGARVTAVVSGAGAALARRLGADETLDYRGGELERHDRTYDVVFDTVFKRPLRDILRFAGRRGAYVTTGFSPVLAIRSGLSRLGAGPRVSMLMSRARGERMRDLSALVAERKLDPVIDSVYPLERVREAYGRLETGHAHGKVVLAIP